MSLKKSLLITGSAALIGLTTLGFSYAGSLDGPRYVNEQAPGDEWAPPMILRLNPDSGKLLSLDKESETPEVATYKVKPDAKEPDKSFCRNYPNQCVLVREQ